MASADVSAGRIDPFGDRSDSGMRATIIRAGDRDLRRHGRAAGPEATPSTMRSEAPLPSPEPLDSPRLRRFARAVHGAVPADVDSAWRRLVERGVPLVERVPGHPGELRVTFLWRPVPAVDHASVFAPALDFTVDGTRMTPLEGTGIWYRSVRLPRTTRTEYGFASQLLPTFSDPPRAWAEFYRSLGPDPEAKERVRAGPALHLSVAELPDAPPQPWFRREPHAKWRRETRRIRSRKLGTTRTVRVYRPPMWGTDPRRAAVIVILDGEAYAGDPIWSPRTVANLAEAGRIPPALLVLVDNAPGAREPELGANPVFADFLARELLPSVLRRHRIRADPATTVLVGSSLGGLAAAYAALRHSERFGCVLAQSGAFYAPGPPGAGASRTLMELYARERVRPLRFYLDAGTREVLVPPGFAASLLAGVRHLRDVLAAKGYPVAYREFEGGHDYACWRGTLADGLEILFGTRPAAAARR